MGIIKKHNEIPDWADSFLSSVQEMEKDAAVNVKTLPKVVWNDGTFYVALDSVEGNADVLNEYGNVVTALKNVHSIEDVEQQLNKQIVAKKEIFDNELEKFADFIDSNNTDSNEQNDSNNSASINNNQASSQEIQIEAKKSTISKDMQENLNNQIKERLDLRLTNIEKSIPNITAIASGHSEQIKKHANNVKMLQHDFDKQKQAIASLKDNIKKLAAMVNTLSDQLHAYMNPGNIYDLNCEKKELKHYNNTAKKSERAIQIEHDTDLTTPQGRVSLKDRILQDIDEIKLPNEILTEKVEPNKLENIVNEPKELTIVEVQDKPEIDTKADTIVDVDNIDNNVEIVNVEESNNIKKLNSKQASAVQKRVCPICKKKSLFLDVKTASVQDIVCKNCKAKFGVNLNNAKIFKYIK